MAIGNTAKNMTGSAVKKAAMGKVAGMLAKTGTSMASGMAKSAVGAAAKMAAGAASGGASLAAQAGLEAIKNADKLAQGAASLAAAAASLFSGGIAMAAGTGWSTFGIALIATPLVVGSFLVIINTGAYIVPPDSTGLGLVPLSEVPTDCIDDNFDTTPSLSVEYSSNGQYAFPMAHSNGISCTHWVSQGYGVDTVYATDVFPISASRVPLVAYTSGSIVHVQKNDITGGKNLILGGDDGRYYYYAHFCKIKVNLGQRVSVGEFLGVSDSTGLNAAVTPEHLHFAIGSGSNFVPLGSGTVCPAVDFKQKFGHTRCDEKENNYCGKDFSYY